MIHPELLPCPFCGAVAWLYEDSSSDNASQWTHAANCAGCEAQGASHYDKDAAIAAWNRRHALPK